MAEQPEKQTRVSSVLEDPSAQVVARLYAGALLDATPEAEVDGVLEELDSFATDVLEPNPEFGTLLLSGMLSRDERNALIDRVVVGRASDRFANFLRVLNRHERLELLPVICNQIRLIHEERSGLQRIQVRSAAPLSDATLQQIQDKLAAAFSFTPIIETDVDPSLLGGLVIQVEDKVYDSSLRSRLKQLRDRMRERSLHEIQSGRDRFSHPAGD